MPALSSVTPSATAPVMDAFDVDDGMCWWEVDKGEWVPYLYASMHPVCSSSLDVYILTSNCLESRG